MKEGSFLEQTSIFEHMSSVWVLLQRIYEKCKEFVISEIEIVRSTSVYFLLSHHQSMVFLGPLISSLNKSKILYIIFLPVLTESVSIRHKKILFDETLICYCRNPCNMLKTSTLTSHQRPHVSLLIFTLNPSCFAQLVQSCNF